jgi:hypothetical protein
MFPPPPPINRIGQLPDNFSFNFLAIGWKVRKKHISSESPYTPYIVDNE